MAHRRVLHSPPMSASDRPPFPEIQPPDATLGKALNARLQAAGSPLRVKGYNELFGKGSPWWAVVHQGPRTAQVSLALHERSATTDLWERGIQVARHTTAELSATVELLRDWLERSCAMDELPRRHPGVSLSAGAAVHLAGAEAEVAEAWQDIRRRVEQRSPALLPLVLEAERAPELRRLYPYLTKDRLTFSRCTGYPFTTDCPAVKADAAGFEIAVRDTPPSRAKDVAEAVLLIVSLLPAGCGAAIQGTADDVPRLAGAS